MNDPATVTINDAAPPVAAPEPYRQQVGHLVARRAVRLADTRDRSSTIASLARLRANLGREPGTDPTVWAWTIDGVPGEPRGDAPTYEEWAVHLALTLFASHQQSRPGTMHHPGVGFGAAVARLDRAVAREGVDGPSSVRRRFDAAVTSASLPELAHHLRGLVKQLRGAGVGLDYGMLADDLVQFQRPGGADTVRRRWARQYYHLDRNVPVATPDTTSEENQ
jgi:CRISPR system Cascade subunit CasB